MYHINVTELPTGTVQEIVAHGDESIKIVNHLHLHYIYKCAVAAFTVYLGPSAFTQTLTHEAGYIMGHPSYVYAKHTPFLQFLQMYLKM